MGVGNNKYIFQSFILAFAFLSTSFESLAQNQDTVHTIFGKVIDEKTRKPIPNVHVINKTSFVGTVTNTSGFFNIELTNQDTIVFSSLGYQYSFYTYKKKLEDQLIIILKEKNYLLEEVSVYSYKLTANNPVAMSVGKPMIPKTEDISFPEAVEPTWANPVDLLYYMFGNRPKQMKQLQVLQSQDAYRQKLQDGNNREIMMDITGLSRDELESLMFFCKYSKTYIRTANDYEFLISLLSCYQEYMRIQEMEGVLEPNQEENNSTIEERFK